MATPKPPFLQQSGNGQASSGPAHNFVESPSLPSPGGGRDFTKESRSQSEAKPEVVPNPQEIPKGGKYPNTAPGAAQKDTSGGVMGVPKKPFKI